MTPQTPILTLTPGDVSLADLERVFREECAIRLDASCRPAIELAHSRIAAAAAGNTAVYGVNTGFGKLASVKIAAEDTATLQRNLILSHCCGVGPAIPRAHARLMMALKLLSLGRGASGVRLEVIDLLEAMLATGVTPVIPAQGSVGASGDLAPLSHMAAVMMGAAEAEFGGTVMSGAAALAAAGLTPIELGPKEGLALINGTQFSTAFGLAGLFGAWAAAQSALVTSALTTDAIMGSTAPLQPEIHSLRGHRGQIEAGEAMRALLDGSEIRESHRDGDARVQDPYCIRCQPQVTGAAMDVLRGQLEIWRDTFADASTDYSISTQTLRAQLETLGPEPESGEPEAIAQMNTNGSGVEFMDIHPDYRPFFEALTDKGVNWSGKHFGVQDDNFIKAFENAFCASAYMFLHPEATLQSEPLGSMQVA